MEMNRIARLTLTEPRIAKTYSLKEDRSTYDSPALLDIRYQKVNEGAAEDLVLRSYPSLFVLDRQGRGSLHRVPELTGCQGNNLVVLQTNHRNWLQLIKIKGNRLDLIEFTIRVDQFQRPYIKTREFPLFKSKEYVTLDTIVACSFNQKTRRAMVMCGLRKAFGRELEPNTFKIFVINVVQRRIWVTKEVENSKGYKYPIGPDSVGLNSQGNTIGFLSGNSLALHPTFIEMATRRGNDELNEKNSPPAILGTWNCLTRKLILQSNSL